MEIGELLSQFRAQYKLTVSDLAQKAQVEASGLSRVEKGYTEVSMLYIQRVIEANNILDIYPNILDGFVLPTNTKNADFTIEKDGIKLLFQVKNTSDIQHGSKLLVDDISKFITFFYEYPTSGADILADALNAASEIIYKDAIYGIEHWPFVLNQETKLFNRSDIIRMFHPNDFYTSAISYPKEIPLKFLHDFFSGSGAVGWTDAGAYFRTIRLEKNIDVKTLAKETKISQPVLSRIENADLTYAKFHDILKIDNILECAGKFTALCWFASSLQNKIEKELQNTQSSSIEKNKIKSSQVASLVSLLIKSVRWIEYTDENKFKAWLRQFRSSISR